MKIYTAARYALRGHMVNMNAQLQEAGHEPTARWVYGLGDTTGEGPEGALADLEDVNKSDCLIFFAEPHGSSNPGGGRHFEFGYAYAQGIHTIVVGEKETIFCHLPSVHVFATLDEAIAHLAELEDK